MSASYQLPKSELDNAISYANLGAANEYITKIYSINV